MFPDHVTSHSKNQNQRACGVLALPVLFGDEVGLESIVQLVDVRPRMSVRPKLDRRPLKPRVVRTTPVAACGGCFVCTGLIIDAPEETDATGPLVRVLIANKIGNCRLGHNLRYPLSIEVSRATLHHTGHTFVRSMLVGFATGLRTCCVELQS